MREKQVKTRKKGPYKKVEYEEFVRFTALTRILRQQDFGFITDEAFIKHFKLSSATVFDWKSRDSFWAEVARTTKRWSRDRTPDVIFSLYRTAVKEGKAPEVKLWMEIFENFSTKNETSLNLHRDTLKDIQDSTRALLEQEKNKSI